MMILMTEANIVKSTKAMLCKNCVLRQRAHGFSCVCCLHTHNVKSVVITENKNEPNRNSLREVTGV